MKTETHATQLLTVDDLNAIQADWMKLESTAPDAEKRRVFALMDTLPKCYLGVSEDGALACPVIDGTPMVAERIPLNEARAWLQRHVTQWNAHKFRFDVGWCGKSGQWIQLPEWK